jgi:spermidine/putrescine transport system permease protein
MTRLGPAALAAPLALWLAIFIAFPAAILLVYSFFHVDGFKLVYELSLRNYEAIVHEELFRRALAGSLLVGLTTAAVTSVIAFALAWALRFHFDRGRDLLVLAIVVSSIGSYLARLYSWRSILGADGAINYLLQSAHLIDEPLSFLIFNRFAVVVTLVNVFLPFAFLPVYVNLLGVRPDVLQAGRVLGAGPVVNFLRVGLPLGATGLAISFIYVFIFATADFAAPKFLGGPTGIVFASLIADMFGIAFNWPLGAALSFVYIGVLGLIVGLLAWYVARKTRRIGG